MIRGWKTTLGTLKFSNTHVYAQIHNLLLCTNLVCGGRYDPQLVKRSSE